ncbi:hypothetical protein KZZ07_19225 [Mameliella sp. CS4]|uniref:hypothetical protein n=1 Tax=Mameliella sp. CS4 TaxID=2862329 RepID=UPI001C5D7663|nr:hypothetical protein [Mameliella sp. CS4]MBW4984676.1 hypothetical protein [Mameliella sp. CS4]
MLKNLLVILGLMLAVPALAQDEEAVLGNDVYKAGQSVRMDEDGRDDAFLAGERVRLAAPVTGNAHMAGRWVDIGADLGGSLYAAGQRVRIEGAVAGDAAVAGYTVAVDAPVGGDLRAFGSEVSVTAAIGESLILNGEIVELDAPVTGDAVISARELTFGPGARIDGTLTLYEEEVGTLVVPEAVVPEERVTRVKLRFKRVSGAFQHPGRGDKRSFGETVGDYLAWGVIIGLIGAVAALIAPKAMGSLADDLLERPFRSVLSGFLGLSVLLGGGVLVALTMIGMLLTPFFWLAAVALGLAGLVVGAYGLGAKVMSLAPAFSKPWIGRVLAAFVGALLTAVIGLVPFLGWIAMMAILTAGAGALSKRLPILSRLAD